MHATLNKLYTVPVANLGGATGGIHSTIHGSTIDGNSLVSWTLPCQPTDTTSCTDPDTTIPATLSSPLLSHLVYCGIHELSGTSITRREDPACTTGDNMILVAHHADLILTTAAGSISTTRLTLVDISDDMVLPYTGSGYVYTVRFHLPTPVRGNKFIHDLFNLAQVYPGWTIGTTIVFIYRQHA